GLPHATEAGTPGVGETKPASAAAPTIRTMQVIEGGATRRPRAATATRRALLADNVIALVPKWKARLAAMARRARSSTSTEIDAAPQQPHPRWHAIARSSRHA